MPTATRSNRREATSSLRRALDAKDATLIKLQSALRQREDELQRARQLINGRRTVIYLLNINGVETAFFDHATREQVCVRLRAQGKTFTLSERTVLQAA